MALVPCGVHLQTLLTVLTFATPCQATSPLLAIPAETTLGVDFNGDEFSTTVESSSVLYYGYQTFRLSLHFRAPKDGRY